MVKLRVLFFLFLIVSFGPIIQGQPIPKKSFEQGIVKIKFKPEMTLSLQSMRVDRSQGKLITGIQTFDEVSSKAEASEMERLFPVHPDPRIEARHRKHGLHLWYKLKVTKEKSALELANQYQQLEQVQYAEVEYKKIIAPHTVLFESLTTTMFEEDLPFNDPRLGDQWHYNNDGSIPGSISGADISLFEAWQVTAGSPEVIVSVHDQGMDYNHIDLIGNMWVNQAEFNGQPGVDDDGNGFVDDIHGWNFDNNSAQIDPEYHGTHVAGTIAAVNNNGIGVAGVAGGTGNNDGAKIMALQMIAGTGIEASFVYAADNGAVISQNSWGYSSPGVKEESVYEGIKYFIEEAGSYPGSPMRGGVVIFAAGNNNADGDFYPGYYEEVIAVGATAPDYSKASYSNFGTWVDISAPGGESGFLNGGVLSTMPDNSYGYIDGTSMACPHVSGVAALVLANRGDKQYSADELKRVLLTSFDKIDQYLGPFEGLMGVGQLNAALAVETNAEIPPNAITDLALSNISQEFAQLNWTVPSDPDDDQPISFKIYVSENQINEATIASAQVYQLENDRAAGEQISFEVGNLFGLTEYHFMVLSEDRWGLVSNYSNILTASTNAGPSIALDENSWTVDLSIDVQQKDTAAHVITIINNDAGLLRWDSEPRQQDLVPFANSQNIAYPVVTNTKSTANDLRVQTQPIHFGSARADLITPTVFEPSNIYYTGDNGLVSIGETDLTLPNSSATKFTVNDPDGFNLTHVGMYLQHDKAFGPIIVEIYKGQLDPANLLLAQEYYPEPTNIHDADIQLIDQLYFATGESFYIVFHVPPGTRYPLVIAPELEEEYSDLCYYSSDLGKSWITLEEAILTPAYAWTTLALSRSRYPGEFLSLSPASGEVMGFDNMQTKLEANASQLVNGNYSASVLIHSNDANQRELRIPVSLAVTGHQPNLVAASVQDFGGVFIGANKTENVIIENIGLGSFDVADVSSSNPQFEISQGLDKISSLSARSLEITFTPTMPGSSSGQIFITGNNGTFSFTVYGSGIIAPEAVVNPDLQTITPINLGDTVTAQFTLANNGEYPLKYFVPGWDEQGITSEITGNIHKYGYKVQSNELKEEIPFVWEEISNTGVNITDFFFNENFSGPGEEFHYTVPLEFSFPFYSHVMDTVYITKFGMIDFDNSKRLVNYPRLGFEYGPNGQIAAAIEPFEFSVGGAVYYKMTDEKLIVQYEQAQSLWFEGNYMTFQIVIHRNGDINMYYKDIMSLYEYAEAKGWPLREGAMLEPMIEDPEKLDGIQLNGYNTFTNEWVDNITWRNELAFQFQYPGPDIIVALSNGSGVVLPGESVVIEADMATASLYEGTIKRSINVISNDPVNPTSVSTAILEITSGGSSELQLSTSAIDFGSVFQGADPEYSFNIKNIGTATEQVFLSTVNNNYTIVGEPVATLQPQRLQKYTVSLPTTTSGLFEDEIILTDTKGNEYTVSLTGTVMDPPGIAVDLTNLVLNVPHGQKVEVPITIESNGQAALEIASWGTEWLTVDINATDNATQYLKPYTYHFESSDNESTEVVYDWREIRQTGIKIEETWFDFFDSEKSWYGVKLPFGFEYYGEIYDSLFIGYNGILTLTSGQEAAIFPERIPSEFAPLNLIAPLWMAGGPDTYLYPDDAGIYYEVRDNMIIVTYSYIINVFGMGGVMSFQSILMDNGSIKFQYRLEEQSGEQTSSTATVGLINKDATDVVQISGEKNLGISQDGLAFVLSPAPAYAVPSGETVSGTVTFDATKIYAGTYSSSLKYQTVIPGSELLERPMVLRVLGEAELETSILDYNFGDILAYQKDGEWTSYGTEFELQNNGSASISVSDIYLRTPDDQYNIEVYMKLNGVWNWQSTNLLSDHPGLSPEESMRVRINLRPNGQSLGNLTNSLVIDTRLPDLEIPLQANVIPPAVLNVPMEEIGVTFTLPSEIANRSVALNNIGQSILEYSLSIEYSREENPDSSSAESIVEVSNHSLPVAVASSGTGLVTYDIPNFNRVLAYETATSAENFIGYNGNGVLSAATRFNAGEEGFNLTHIQTFMRLESQNSAELTITILAGSNLNEAVQITSFTYSVTGNGNDENGNWVTVELPENVVFAPNEQFYIAIKYPYEINYPQGVINASESTPDQYLLFFEGTWQDFQQYDGFEKAAWLMRAAEETYASTEWVTITSSATGTILPGENSPVRIEFAGSNAVQGRQVANLVINSNDPLNPIVRVPLSLYLNEGPKFVGAQDSYLLNELDTVQINISVIDSEGDAFTVRAESSTAGWSFDEGVLSLQLAYGLDGAGEYKYMFTATDVHGAVNELQLNVKVNNVNRPPEAIDGEQITLVERGVMQEFFFNNYVIDKDGDQLSYSIQSNSPDIVEAFSSDEKFVLRPGRIGSTSLTVIATDNNGAAATIEIPVDVTSVLGLEDFDSELSVYPNPATDIVNIEHNNFGSKRIMIDLLSLNGTVSRHFEFTDMPSRQTLDFSDVPPGVYLLRITGDDFISSVKLIKE